MGSEALHAEIIAALATPVDADGRLDERGLERLVDHVLNGGADGVSPVGSTGEGARFSARQRAAITARVRQLVPIGQPVIAGAPIQNCHEGLLDLQALAEAGATAALVSVSTAYPSGDADLVKLWETLVERTPIPMVIYNIPAYTHAAVPASLVTRLARHEHVLGIKDSSRDLEYLQEIATDVPPGFRVFTGADTMLLASLAVGAHGTISASVNLVPERARAVMTAFRAMELSEARRCQTDLTRVVSACRYPYPPAGWKAALAILGICHDYMAPPASALPRADRHDLAGRLVELGVTDSSGSRLKMTESCTPSR